MKISTILDHIDSGHMALPEFQRGYVWNRDQVRGLVSSLYKRYPVGSLLVWATESSDATHRGDQKLAAGVVKLLLDGQQRMTSLYGLIRGKSPRFFDGDPNTFSGLFFHLEDEEFSFYMPTKMDGNPLWVDVTRLMQENITPYIGGISSDPELAPKLPVYVQRLTQLHSLQDIDVHVEEVTGKDKTIDVVVEIFNKVNSGGTKLSKGDLALAKICSEEPLARANMRQAIDQWHKAGFDFKLDWLLRNINTIATGEALFTALHDIHSDHFSSSLDKAIRHVNYLLDVIGGHLGLDHHRVLFGYYSFPILVRLIEEQDGAVSDQVQLKKMLFWYVHCALWGRYSGSTESTLNRDLEILENSGRGIDGLIREIQLWRGGLMVLPEHFTGWSRGARFYPMLYMLTRVGEARDWGLGIPLKKGMLGKSASLEVHHIFPRNLLKKHGHDKAQINAVANFCFLTKSTNIRISDREPAIYFEEIEKSHPGALESQWIPMDRSLWKVENYPDFLKERRRLLAKATNHFLDGLYQIDAGEDRSATMLVSTQVVPGGIESKDEEEIIQSVQEWLEQKGLPTGEVEYELMDKESGKNIAILDIAWPDGVQVGLSDPMALLLDEPAEVLNAANREGFQLFENAEELKTHVANKLLGDHLYGLPDWAGMIDSKAVEIVRHIVNSNLPQPQCGYELVSDQSEVKGELELAWPEQKVGIWTRRGRENSDPILLEGWMTFTQKEVLESPGLLNTSFNMG